MYLSCPSVNEPYDGLLLHITDVDDVYNVPHNVYKWDVTIKFGNNQTYRDQSAGLILYPEFYNFAEAYCIVNYSNNNFSISEIITHQPITIDNSYVNGNNTLVLNSYTGVSSGKLATQISY